MFVLTQRWKGYFMHIVTVTGIVEAVGYAFRIVGVSLTCLFVLFTSLSCCSRERRASPHWLRDSIAVHPHLADMPRAHQLLRGREVGVDNRPDHSTAVATQQALSATRSDRALLPVGRPPLHVPPVRWRRHAGCRQHQYFLCLIDLTRLLEV